MTDSTSAYIAIPLSSLKQSLRDIQFDVYLKLGEDNYAHVFSRTTGLDYKRLAQYVQKGIREAFIKKEDEVLYQDFLKNPPIELLKSASVTNEKKIAVLLNLTEQNLAEIFCQLKVEDEVAQSTSRVIKGYVDLLVGSPRSLALILNLVSHGEYLYYHSIAVSIFSIFLGKATGVLDAKTLQIVGMGGFLHDIGHALIPDEINEAARELTNEEWEVIRTHPKLGLDMVRDATNIPDEVKYIIYQHHEHPSKDGYPNQLKSTAIYYPAKIVSIADSFSSLISKRPYRPAFTIPQALKVIQNEKNRFDKPLVELMTSIFGTEKNEKTKKAA
ncbi:MAG: HD domain-containing protein [Xanthomonadaceae bacterium]|nr:HD domain-containing protein [Xanthomonadaceae bacterium]